MVFEYKQLVPVLFGVGAMKLIGEKVSSLGCKKALCLYDSGIKSTGIIEKTKEVFKASGVEFVEFDRVEPDAPIGVINEGGAFAREHKVDAVVAIGGGSCLDTAKAVAALISNDLPVEKYLHHGPPRELPISVPMFLVPTTSGTGSEVTRVSVISHTGENAKMALFFKFFPGTLAIVDPEMTVSAPPSVTAFAGLDALSHTIESITAKNRNPRSEVLASAAIKMIFKYLPIAYKDGSNLEAREKLCLASNWAGIAFTDSDVQFGHALADSISAACHTPHGLNCAWVTPEMINFVSQVIPDKVRVIGDAIGLDFPDGVSDEQVTAMTAGAVRNLMRSVGIKSLSEMGFSRDAIVAGAAGASVAPLTYNSPVPVTLEATQKLLGDIYDNF